MVLIPTFESEMSGVLSKLLDEQFLPSVAWCEGENQQPQEIRQSSCQQRSLKKAWCKEENIQRHMSVQLFVHFLCIALFTMKNYCRYFFMYDSHQ